MRQYSFLKTLRVLTAVVFIILISSTFFDIYNFIPADTARYIALTQFIPSLLNFINLPAAVFSCFIIIIVLTLTAGRSYCSFFCPLGIYQDIITRLASILRIKKIYRYNPPHNFIRYSILGLTLISYSAAGTSLVLWLDPFSIYGRFASGILSPAITGINNRAAVILLKSDIYALHPVDIKYMSRSLIFVIITMMITISVFAVLKGRLYCNTICPAGTLLGLISKNSFLKIEIDNNSCIHCGKCEKICKSSCISHDELLVDFSRCVSCFNCVKSCPNSSIRFKNKNSKEFKTQEGHSDNEDFFTCNNSPVIARRTFLSGLVFLPSILTAQTAIKKQVLYVQDISKQKYYKKKTFTPPPGSFSTNRFNERCTACSLCITRCPSSVLQPAVMQYGIRGIMQPFLDFNSGYCNYDCTVCGEVCPTGSIKKISVAEKHLIQTGKSSFIKENCITYTNGTACGACSEHCPTKAVNMVPYKNGLVIPEVNNAICIGCGACEYVCPVRPIKAIFVEGSRVHEKAELPKKETKIIIKKEDFPF